MPALPLFPCLERTLHLSSLHLALHLSLDLDQQMQTGMLAPLPLMKPQRPRMQVRQANSVFACPVFHMQPAEFG